MVYLKNNKEIKLMAEAGRITAEAMRQVAKKIAPGVKTVELDTIAEETIKKMGAESSFKKVENYKFTVCTTPNDWVVHGIPGEYELQDGDLLGVDLGAFYKGYHSDMAHTFPVGKVSEKEALFLKTGQKALMEAIKITMIGNTIGDISSTIQTIVENEGYSVVRELVGHGVGKSLHEDPLVPGVGKKATGPKIKRGMVLAIEVIYNMNSPKVELLEDGWTIATKDGAKAGLFERTVAVTDKGPAVLTKEPEQW